MILKPINLNIRASQAEKAMLEQVAQAHETTPSEMMRQLIRKAHAKLGKKEIPMNPYQTARNRVENDPQLDAHSETIFYDWDNQDEHLEWVATAPTDEIVDWAVTVEKQ